MEANGCHAQYARNYRQQDKLLGDCFIMNRTFTCVCSTCHQILLVSTCDRKSLINSKSSPPIRGCEIETKRDWILRQPMNPVQTKPVFTCHVTEAILILDPCPIAKPLRAIESLLKHCPASTRCSLVAVDWERTEAVSRGDVIDPADGISRVIKISAVGIN